MATTPSRTSQITPIYPVELLGTEEIHNFIPHLPVYDCRDGRTTIPIGDHETVFTKLGILVSRIDPESQEFILDLEPAKNGEFMLPNSIGLRKALPGRIGTFTVDLAEKRKAKAVKAYTTSSERIDLGWFESSNLLPFLKSAVATAYNKRRKYLGMDI